MYWNMVEDKVNSILSRNIISRYMYIEDYRIRNNKRPNMAFEPDAFCSCGGAG